MLFNQSSDCKNMSYITFAYYKAIANLRSESSQTILSYFWWLLEPVLEVAVLFLVFGIAFNSPIENFISFLFIGTVVWSWVAKSTVHSMMSIKENKYIINTVYIPKFVFPLSILFTDFLKQLIVFFVLLCWLFFVVDLISWTVIFLPILIIVQMLLVCSIGFTLSAITPFMPDLRFIVTALLQLAMFCSGIFYDVSSLPKDVQELLFFNPFIHLISFYRDVLMYGKMPNLEYLAGLFSFSLLFFVLAVQLLKKLDKVYARVVN